MTSSRAQRLREQRQSRMTIDPDAATAPTAPAQEPAAETVAEVREQTAPEPPPEPEPAATQPARPAPRRASAPAKKTTPVLNALEDPDCHPGEKDYRSFYLEDSAYFRYRAAIYWASRHPEGDDVPENMTAGVEEYMIDAAADMERRFNGGEPFRMPPATKRRGRTARRRRNTG